MYHPRNQGFDYYYGHILTNVKDFSGEGDRVVLSQRPFFFYQCGASVLAAFLTSLFLYKKNYIGKLLFLITFLTLSSPGLYLYFVFNNFILINSLLFRNFEVVEQPIKLETLMKRYVTESLNFMEESKNSSSPFLLVVAFSHTHTSLDVAPEFRGKSKHGRYGDNVLELDWGVGQLMSGLDRLGLSDNTLVYFTSDNGAHLEERGVHGEVDGGSNGILKGIFIYRLMIYLRVIHCITSLSR